MAKSKFTKLLCIALSLLMILGAAPLSAFAADTSLTGFSGGDGTESNPYQISNKAELENLAAIVNGGNGCADTYFKLTADIGTAADPVTTIIGNNSFDTFQGHFDGNGQTVTLNIGSELSIDEVVSEISELVENIDEDLLGEILASPDNAKYLLDCDPNVIDQIVAIINQGPKRIVGLFSCLDENGEIKNVITKGSVCGWNVVGSVCGWNYGGTIIDCCNKATVSGNSSIGGICGEVIYKPVFNCCNFGKVSGTGEKIGGVCGDLSSASITNCFNFGNVSGAGASVGGLCGTTVDANATNCCNLGNVSGKIFVGGLFGDLGGGNTTNCYSAGAVSGEVIGGVGGYAVNESFTNCYFDSEIFSGNVCDESSDGTFIDSCGLSTEQMKAASGTDGALIDLLNGYIDDNSDATADWARWTNKAGMYPRFPWICEYSAKNNVLTVTVGAVSYTLTLTENGTISAEEISAWKAAGFTVPDIVFDTTANTASITADDKTAVITLAEDALKAHSVKVICGADANGKSYIPDVLPGTAVTVTAGFYEGKAFEKWNTGLSIDGSTDETVTFRMPNEDVTIEAEFVDCYPLSVFDGTTLTSTPQKVNYNATVTAPTAPEGMRFKNWTAEGITLTDATASTLAFTMPGNAVMLTANYIAPHTVTVSGGTITGAGASDEAFEGETISVTADEDTDDSRFTQWSSEAEISFANKNSKATTFTMPDADVTVTAEREQSYTVTVTDGTASGLNTAGKAFAGDTVTVTANSISGYNFTGWTGEGVTFANAANTTTTFTMPGSNVTVKANYEQIKVTAPTAGTGVYTYNGNAQTYQFASEGDKSYYSLSGNVQTNAGTYTVKASLTVDGTVWTDGTTADKEYTFVIARQPVDKPMAYDTEYYYDGTVQKFILCKQVGSSYYYYESMIPAGSVTITGNTRTDAGTQTVTATPTTNYCWSDATTEALSFTFTVNRYPVPVLFSDPRSFTYNANAQKYTPFMIVGGNLYDFDGAFYNLANRIQTATGDYTVTATLDDNFCWQDGSTASRDFSFNIKKKQLDGYIYYLDNLDAGGASDCVVNVSYTEFDNISALKDFSNHPKFKEDMLKDHYMPRIENVPADAEVTFFIKEDAKTPQNFDEIYACTKWNNVKMSDLKPNTIYYMFAVVSCDGYDSIQVTDITNYSRFITTDPMFSVSTAHTVTEEEINTSYGDDVLGSLLDGGAYGILGAFSGRKSTKETTVAVKDAYFSDLYEAIEQGIRDIEEGLDFVMVSWWQNGQFTSFNITSANISTYRNVLNAKSALRSAPRNMLASPAGDPALITGISDEPAEFTFELLNAMFGTEQAPVLLNKEEFKVELDLGLAGAQPEDKNEALINRLTENGLITETAEPLYTVTVSNLLYDPATGIVDGESKDYMLGAGEKLPADAVKEIEGYTFDGLYYKDIFDFELADKSEDATGDHGMILTQGLVKWNPETDYVTRDLDLMAIYVKDGAQEPVGYLTSGTTFLDEGSEVVIALPALMDGMTYGDVINDNADISVNAVADGKVTVTLANDVTGDEPFTFTVGVNANKEGVEDPIYYVIVTVNAVDDAECKEEAAETIEALADDTASDEVKAIVADAVASLEDANSIEAVNEIVADAEAAVALQKAKEAAIAAIDAAVAEAANSGLEGAAESAAAAAEEAKAAINAATTVEEVNAAKKAGTSAIVAASVCEHCGTRHQNIIFKIICKLIKLIYAMLDIFKTIGF